MQGTDDSIFAIGDCTATSYAPTAQVASQQGAYLARLFKQMARKDNLQAKLSELQEKAAQPGVDDEEKKKAEREVDGVTKQLEKLKLRPFHYSHQGSLASVFFFLGGYGQSWQDAENFYTGISVQIRQSRTFRS